MEFSSINKTNQKEQGKAICYIMEPIKIIDRMAYLYTPNDSVNFIPNACKRMDRMTEITRKNKLYCFSCAVEKVIWKSNIYSFVSWIFVALGPCFVVDSLVIWKPKFCWKLVFYSKSILFSFTLEQWIMQCSIISFFLFFYYACKWTQLLSNIQLHFSVTDAGCGRGQKA